MKFKFYTAICLIVFVRDDGVALYALKLAKRNMVLHLFNSTYAHWSSTPDSAGKITWRHVLINDCCSVLTELL